MWRPHSFPDMVLGTQKLQRTQQTVEINELSWVECYVAIKSSEYVRTGCVCVHRGCSLVV